ncbi:DUF599 family protein [Terasakiella sp. SH-1]|uniref:DUF599 domain-containing protein n=1 Tax=Terasakiella sp. SH-1 TaxID=2560057 RepID=UPI001074514B|nr:DUF599 family protein [Terasakiella sp. SH-1]
MNIEFMHGVTLLDALALLWFLIAWAGYTKWADRFSQQRSSLMNVMYHYRLEWMREALKHEIRVADMAAVSTLVRSISLFASTAIFIIGGIVAIFGGLDQVQELTKDLRYVASTTKVMWEIKLLTLALIFVYAFFKFAWSLRQFNYMVIVMGAFPDFQEAASEKAQTLAERAARINALAVQTFNRGMRAYYFGLAALSWFIHPLIFIASTLLVVLVVYRREFHSKTLRVLDPNSDYEAVIKS